MPDPSLEISMKIADAVLRHDNTQIGALLAEAAQSPKVFELVACTLAGGIGNLLNKAKEDLAPGDKMFALETPEGTPSDVLAARQIITCVANEDFHTAIAVTHAATSHGPQYCLDVLVEIVDFLVAIVALAESRGLK